MTKSPCFPAIQIASREQMRLARKFGERHVGTDGAAEIVGYVYGGIFYVTEERHHEFQQARRAAQNAGRN